MELTLDQALQRGIEAHKAGKVKEADRYYTAILKANPKHPDANHNMGVLAVGVGKYKAALPFFKTALEANSSIAQYWLSYVDALIKLDCMADAKAVLDRAKSNNVKGDSIDQLEKRLNTSSAKVKNQTQEDIPTPLNILDDLSLDKALKLAIKKLKDGLSEEAKKIYHDILVNFPKNKRALDGIKTLASKTLANSSDMEELPGDQFRNLINLYSLGQHREVINKALQLLQKFPESANLYNIIGAANQSLGKLDQAIDALTKALSIEPSSAETYNNVGIILKDQGKLKEAIEAYNKSLSLKPDNAEVYFNLGNALKAQGRPEEAIEAYTKALSIKPDHAETHRSLSTIKQYTVEDEHFLQVKEIYRTGLVSEGARSHLSFALAKMYEDIGNIEKSFSFLIEGNTLRKKLMNYSFYKEIDLFTELKKTQPYLQKNLLEIKESSTDPTPVFILGMPRSGTTLVEQIVSSHSEVIGAGELNHVSRFGAHLALNPTAINTEAISEFRVRYLSELSQLSNGKQCVTDKMPQNFRFIPLICAAFPEAKIVHVERNAAATCWSNYKQYFPAKDLGYCYDLSDIVEYYNLYKDLMKLWQLQYSDRIYNLDYETLVTDQENQTRKLISHLGLNWQDACLSPHANKRSVRTASQQQVTQKVYQRSSEAWQKYQPFLDGAFDSLAS